MDPLLITTQVDLSGAQQLSAGVVAAMTKVIAAQQEVNAQAKNLAETYKQLGAAAAQGSSSAAGIIAQEMGLLAEKKIILGQVQEAYREATAATTEDAAAHLQDAAAIEVENVAQRSSISERAAASASIRILEGNLQGSTRAAGAFLATTLGLGPILQAAFPVIGAIALIEVLGRIPEAFHKMQDALAGWDKDSEKAFTRNIAEADHLDQVYERLAGQEAKIPIQNLEGPAKWKAEVESLEEYQQRVARLQVQFGGLKTALDAADSSTLAWLRDTTGTSKGFGILPEEAVHADAVRANIDKQLQQINEIRNAEARAYNQPLPVPLTLNFATSEATLKKQIDQMVEDLRKDISRRSEEIAEAGIQIKSKAAPEDTAAAQQRDRIARQEAESNKAAAMESEHAWQAAYKGATSAIQENERQNIEATDAGSHARIQAIDAAIKEQRTLGLQKGDVATKEGEEAADTDYYKSLLNQRLAAVKAESTAEVAAQLKGLNEAAKAREHSIQDSARQQEALAGIAVAQAKAAVPGFESPDEKANREITAAQSSAATQNAIAQQVANTKAESALKVSAAYELEYLTGAISEEKYLAKTREISYQVSAAWQDAAAKSIQAWTRESEQEIAIRQAAAVQEIASVHDFVNQSTSALNGFLVTIITTTGSVNGRINELWYIGAQWRKMMLQMEKDFYQMIFKTIENTALFRNFQNTIQGALGSAFKFIGLGGQGAGGAAGSAATGVSQTQATVALNAFTVAVHSATAAMAANVPPTTASTAAKTAEVPAVTASTTAHTANSAGVHSSTLAHLLHAVFVHHSSAAHLANAAAATSATTATVAQTVATTATAVAQTSQAGAVAADTSATVADTVAKYAFAFEEGGVVPYTGLHLVHEGERVLSTKQRADYEQMMAGARIQSPFAQASEGASAGAGVGQPHTSGEPSGSFALHYHAGNVSALDHSGVDAVLRKSQGELVRIMKHGLKTGAINARQLARR